MQLVISQHNFEYSAFVNRVSAKLATVMQRLAAAHALALKAESGAKITIADLRAAGLLD